MTTWICHLCDTAGEHTDQATAARAFLNHYTRHHYKGA